VCFIDVHTVRVSGVQVYKCFDRQALMPLFLSLVLVCTVASALAADPAAGKRADTGIKGIGTRREREEGEESEKRDKRRKCVLPFSFFWFVLSFWSFSVLVFLVKGPAKAGEAPTAAAGAQIRHQTATATAGL
jgi:hypothetical protein